MSNSHHKLTFEHYLLFKELPLDASWSKKKQSIHSLASNHLEQGQMYLFSGISLFTTTIIYNHFIFPRVVPRVQWGYTIISSVAAGYIIGKSLIQFSETKRLLSTLY